MGTVSIHPIEYLKLHLYYEGAWIRLLRSLIKKVFESLERAVTMTVFLLAVGLVIFSFVRIVQSASIAASYDASITEVVLPPLQAIPTGMYPFSTASL